MPQLPLSFERAAAARDAAIEAVSGHAERESPGWSDAALAEVERFARQHQAFMAEDALEAARARGLSEPHDPRAFGGVIRRAVAAGLIERAGYGPARTSHLSPKVRWRSLVFTGPLLSSN